MSLNLVISEYLKLDFTSVRQKVVTLCEKLHENVPFLGKGVNFSDLCLIFIFECLW